VVEEPQGLLLPASMETAAPVAAATLPAHTPTQEDVSTNWGGLLAPNGFIADPSELAPRGSYALATVSDVVMGTASPAVHSTGAASLASLSAPSSSGTPTGDPEVYRLASQLALSNLTLEDGANAMQVTDQLAAQ
jgi:hypothetical protein